MTNQVFQDLLTVAQLQDYNSNNQNKNNHNKSLSSNNRDDNINVIVRIRGIGNDENYERPTNIKDKDFVKADKNITNVDLIVDDYGTVKTGTITYKGITYIYQEGSFMVKK